jgi:hypothetical protein
MNMRGVSFIFKIHTHCPSSTLGASWQLIVSTTESIGNSFVKLADELLSMSEKVNSITKQNKKERKNVIDKLF